MGVILVSLGAWSARAIVATVIQIEWPRGVRCRAQTSDLGGRDPGVAGELVLPAGAAWGMESTSDSRPGDPVIERPRCVLQSSGSRWA
jgi:hypothetical protein